MGQGTKNITHMENNSSAQEICTVCGKETRGGFTVWEKVRSDGTPIIAIDSTPDRNFNVCDLCNDVVCFRCSDHPESGYCNKCYRKIFPDRLPPEREVFQPTK